MQPPRLSGAFKGAMVVAPLLFASVIAANYTAHLPKHYDFQEISKCVRSLALFLDRGFMLSYSADFKSAIGTSSNICETEMISLTTNSMVIAVVQASNLHNFHSPLKFGGSAICGDYVFGLKRTSNGTLSPASGFVSAFPGLFFGGPRESADFRTRFISPGAWVSSSHKLRSQISVWQHHRREDEDLKLLIAYTGYQSCQNASSEEMFHCGFGVCILNIFVNDGVVNCPFGDCRDEGGCENALRTSPLTRGEYNVTDELTSNGGLLL